MPSVALRAENPEAEEALVVVWDAVRSLGREWEAGPEPPRLAGVQEAIPVVAVVVSWEAARHELTRRLVDVLSERVRDLWRQHRRRLEIVVVTRDGEQLHRVKPPRRWPFLRG